MNRIHMKRLSLLLSVIMLLSLLSPAVMAVSASTEDLAPELLSNIQAQPQEIESTVSETTETVTEEENTSIATTAVTSLEDSQSEPFEAATEQESPLPVIYDPQPVTLNEVQTLIEAYNQAFEEAIAQGGLSAVLEVKKPHWEFAVPQNFMPNGWRCLLVDWNNDFGTDYYTFFVTPTVMAAQHNVTDDISLRNAIALASSGDDILLQSNITLSNTLIDLTGKSLTIKSDMTAPGAPFILTQNNSGTKHIRFKGTTETLILEDITLNGDNVCNMSDGTIITQGGGGLEVLAGGTIILENNAYIKNCFKDGITVGDQGHLEMENGAVVTDCGPSGGVNILGRDSTFIMNGGTITKNITNTGNGGGMRIASDAKVSMYDGEISYNVATTGRRGGGVYISGSRIAGGAPAFYRSSFYMYDGIISNNQSDYEGGGIAVNGHAIFEMEAGEVRNNNSRQGAGGIYVLLVNSFSPTETVPDPTNHFILGSSSNPNKIPIIDGNIGKNGAGIYIKAPMTPVEVYNCVISNNRSINQDNTQFGAGYSGLYLEQTDLNMYHGKIIKNKTTNGTNPLLTSQDGNAAGVFMNAPGRTFTMYDGEISENISAGHIGGLYIVNGSNFIMGDPANVISGTPKINDNHALNGNYGGVLAQYTTNQTLQTYTSFEMYAGEICRNTASGFAGGITILDTSTTTSSATPNGTGSYFHMYNGKIDNNEALNGHSGGGLVSGEITEFKMMNGIISNNRAKTNGGGLSITSGNAFMYDGTITNNSADGYGGGIYIGSTLLKEDSTNPTRFTGVLTGSFVMGNPSSVTISGNPVISNNNCGINGGGVAVARVVSLSQQDCFSTFKTLASTNAEIIGNKALSGHGGGIYTMDLNYANITTASNTVFSGNIASTSATPPSGASSVYPAIGFTGTSASSHPINNYDINNVAPHSLGITTNNNSGSILTPVAGNYLPGTAIYIEAQLDDLTNSFINWTSDNGGFFMDTLSLFTFYTTPPSQNIILTANFTGTTPGGSGGGGSPSGPSSSSYSITVLNDGSGSGTASVTSAVPGTAIALTATPNAGYQFKEWQVVNGGITISNNTFTMPAANVTVKAIFEPITAEVYKITVQNDGYGKANANLTSASPGTEITLTTKPNNGYQFKEWQIVYGDITIASDQFIMPSSNVTVKAIFKPITPKLYSITVQSNGNGKASASPTSATAGTEITLTAVPNNGYRFKEWQIVRDGISIKSNVFTINDNTFIMPNSNVIIKAIFVKKLEINITENIPTKTPNTGDISNPTEFILLILGSLATIWVLTYTVRKKKNT